MKHLVQRIHQAKSAILPDGAVACGAFNWLAS